MLTFEPLPSFTSCSRVFSTSMGFVQTMAATAALPDSTNSVHSGALAAVSVSAMAKGGLCAWRRARVRQGGALEKQARCRRTRGERTRAVMHARNSDSEKSTA